MKKISAFFSPFALLAFMLGCFNAQAQQIEGSTLAKLYIQQHADQLKLTPEDIQGLTVSNEYQSEHNGITHIYFAQTHEGIEVYNAISGIHIKDGKVFYTANRFIVDIASRVNAIQPGIKPEKALLRAADDLGLNEKSKNIQILRSEKNTSAEFAGGNLSRENIPAYLMYHPSASGRLRLCWVMEIHDPRSADQWMSFVDALTGVVLEKVNHTISCTFPGHNHSAQLISDECLQEAGLERMSMPLQTPETEEILTPVADGATYNVFPVPVESPLHGVRKIMTSPADPDASPYGWHDTNGLPGAEYTITRGNNTYSYLDQNADNRPDTTVVPNGGAKLAFNYPFNSEQEPNSSRAAAITQLFYMNNILHDFSYKYGFTEAAGNFQQNNYGKGGRASDAVLSEAQDGTDINNANFGAGVDGAPGRMQMFIWNTSGGNAFIESPAGIAGKYPVRAASFGKRLTTTPITAEIAVGLDGSTSANLGCQTLLNPGNLKNKIVLIDRGTCTFERKTLNAQLAGAIACVVCNFENTLPAGLGDDPTLTGVTIPVVGMRSGDCELMKQALSNREKVQLTLVAPANLGPDSLDASFDNGIVAHEFGHGVSIRLTGGPSVSTCLNNDEQMGEGWSDFFALVTTVKPGQNGKLARGIGNYVLYEGLDGTGIRRAPYSTDLKVNAQTYDDIIGTSAPHPVGEIWATTLWDLYWALVDKYGWDADLYRGKGGNNIAIQLVMDGLKLQTCSPGFVDGRDAIIAADAANNGGANECLIWEVFARRGLGWSADQGSTADRNDGLQAFDTRPECLRTLKVQKTVNGIVKAGDTLSVNLLVYNHKTTPVTNVVLNDELPNGLNLIPASVVGSIKTSVNSGIATFELGTLAAGGSKIIRYLAVSNRSKPSIRQVIDDVEGINSMWQKTSLEGQDTFRITTSNPYKGTKAWTVPGGKTSVDQALYLKDPILVSGKQPVLRFYQNYSIETALDAGIVEVSTNGGGSWEYVPDSLIFRNGYTRLVTYITFSIPKLRGFSGTTGEYIPTYVNLGKYLGQKIQVRFRFGSNDDPANGPARSKNWTIDNIEFMDLVNYDGQVCLTTAEGDKVCAKAPSKGALVEPGLTTSTRDLQGRTRMAIYPNPTNERINVQLEGLPSGQSSANLLSMDGRVLQTQMMSNRNDDSRLLSFDLSGLPAGIYLMQVKGAGLNHVEKVVKF
ncbi:T9SS-dependent M36 family metallopeptidase [Haliscomenobacter sp.]|uniref:T9SS-dependent M36 family metallopeptidase n=1 Tax=Haliscomenobacter sp. TaxID=2717303 RepID=UPI003364D2C8